MSVDDCFVDGSECRHEGMSEAGLMEYPQFEAGRVPGRMGRRHVAFGVVEDQSPARSAFVVLPEPRGKAVNELQPRRRFVPLPGLEVDCRSACLLLQDLVQSCLHGGEGGYGRTCATRDDEPRPVWTSLPITH
jgi:hypothetical protein